MLLLPTTVPRSSASSTSSIPPARSSLTLRNNKIRRSVTALPLLSSSLLNCYVVETSL
jgi:hypothetical protein